MKHSEREQREFMIGGPPSCGGSAPMFFWTRFQERLARVAELIADAYLTGTVDRFPVERIEAIREAKQRMDRAICVGGFDLAEQAIREWEGVWTDALTTGNGGKGKV